MTTLLKAHSLLGFIDGSLSYLEKFNYDDKWSITFEINPAYNTWMTQDQALMALLSATLSTAALSHIIGNNSSRDVW